MRVCLFIYTSTLPHSYELWLKKWVHGYKWSKLASFSPSSQWAWWAWGFLQIQKDCAVESLFLSHSIEPVEVVRTSNEDGFWMLALWRYSRHVKSGAAPLATHPIQPKNILRSLKRTSLRRQVSGYWMLIQKKIHVCSGWKTVISLFLSRFGVGEFSIAAQFCDLCWQDNCIFFNLQIFTSTT